MTPFGIVTATRGRDGKPFIRTRNSDYPGSTEEPVRYTDILRDLRSCKRDDTAIAHELLLGSTIPFYSRVTATDSPFITATQQRAAATLISVVCIAEATRKLGADKLFRAALEVIADHKSDKGLDDLPTLFPFISSARDGREFTMAVAAHRDEGTPPPASAASPFRRNVAAIAFALSPGRVPATVQQDSKSKPRSTLCFTGRRLTFTEKACVNS